MDGALMFIAKSNLSLQKEYVQQRRPAYGDIAQEFRYRGKFDRHITWSNPEPDLYAVDFISMIGAQYLSNEIEGNKRRLGSLLCMEFPSLRRLGMLAIALQRKSHAMSRKIFWKDMIGIMVEDYLKAYDSSSFSTFLQVRFSIRIALAGRVAEELLLGELTM